MQLSAPKIAEIVESLVDVIEAFFDAGKSGVDIAKKHRDQQSIEKDRYADGEIELLVAHTEK
jgi:hypothetical protein